MLKIKQNKKNIMYLIIGRVLAAGVVYSAILFGCYKALIYILDHCITTL